MASEPLQYPVAPTDDVVEQFHGTAVADPYRPLEDPDSEATRSWVAAQSALARAFLDSVPGRDALRKRLAELWYFGRAGAPVKRGERYFYAYAAPLQNQPVIMMRDGLQGEERAVLDPNRFSDDGTVAITSWQVNHGGTQIAYVLTRGGSDWQEVRIRDVASGEDLPEVLQWVRFTAVAWLPDDRGFYYSGFDAPDDPLSIESNQGNQLRLHLLNTPQQADRVVYTRPDAPTLNFVPQITPDERYLVLNVWHAAINRNRLYVRPLDGEHGSADAGGFVRLFDEADFAYDYVGNDGETFYILTDNEAERGRIIAVELGDPAPERWRTVVAERAQTLQSAGMVAGRFWLLHMDNVQHRLVLADTEGRQVAGIPLPDGQAVTGIGGQRLDDALFVQYHGFTTPPTVLRYGVDEEAASPFYEPELAFEPTDFETRQLFVESADGTSIPLYVTHRRNVRLDGSNPVILYGYGGFSVPRLPNFKPDTIAWLEQGGIFAQAALRGGSEFGEAWHRAGMLGNKQNVFDDFHACAEQLIEAGYTARENLVIEGGSNGGLLVAACMLQRPELYGAVLCHVPVIDMLRYQLFSAGRYWVAEYGDPANPEHFPFLYAYSPLHNVRDGAKYPPILLFTADKDDRVVPMHAHKFTATLQARSAPENLVLLRFETKAGHGFGKPVAKLIDQAVDRLAFLDAVLPALNQDA